MENSYQEADDSAHLVSDCGCEVVGPVGRLSEAMMIASERALDGALLDIDLGGDRSFGVASVLQDGQYLEYDPSMVPDAHELRAIPFLAKPFEDNALAAIVNFARWPNPA